MTETSNYKVYCKIKDTFLNENVRKLYFKLAAILIIIPYVKTLYLAFYIRNEIEDLKYSWFTHKSKHNRR